VAEELPGLPVSLKCRQKFYDESYRLAKWKAEEVKKCRPTTLHLKEWTTTLRHFHWSCAYCQGPYESLDHFIPKVLGGVSVANNCIPTCKACNMAKGGLAPQEVTAIPHETIQSVSQYLESFSMKSPTYFVSSYQANR
jgi:5-methylcytosine-specific restriction endonuclease McrA